MWGSISNMITDIWNHMRNATATCIKSKSLDHMVVFTENRRWMIPETHSLAWKRQNMNCLHFYKQLFWDNVYEDKIKSRLFFGVFLSIWFLRFWKRECYRSEKYGRCVVTQHLQKKWQKVSTSGSVLPIPEEKWSCLKLMGFEQSILPIH